MGVSLSLETANEDLRNKVLAKRFHTDEFVNAMEILNRHKIRTKVFNTVGIPGETLEDAIDTLKLNVKVKPTWARCSIMQPYPPTDLFKMCEEQGLFREGFNPDDFDFFYFKESLLCFPEVDRLVNLSKFFSLTVRFPFLLPIVRRLVKLRPNWLYDKFGMVLYGIFGARYERLSLREFLSFARASAGFLFRKKRKVRLSSGKSAPELAGPAKPKALPPPRQEATDCNKDA